jgi:hypothetical protein
MTMESLLPTYRTRGRLSISSIFPDSTSFHEGEKIFTSEQSGVVALGRLF